MIHFVKNPSTMLKREAEKCKNNEMANIVGVLYASGDIAPQGRKCFWWMAAPCPPRDTNVPRLKFGD